MAIESLTVKMNFDCLVTACFARYGENKCFDGLMSSLIISSFSYGGN